MANARNLLAENASVAKAQGASTYILGWFAQAVAIIGGVYAAKSWPGNTIRWFFELLPLPWLIPTVLFIGAVAWFIDIISDLTPNQVAITYGFLGPILAASRRSNGTLASRITEWSALLQHSVGDKIGQWAGNPGAGAMAIICIASAVLIGRRVLAKQANAAAAGAGRATGGMR